MFTATSGGDAIDMFDTSSVVTNGSPMVLLAAELNPYQQLVLLERFRNEEKSISRHLSFRCKNEDESRSEDVKELMRALWKMISFNKANYSESY
jgi:hypothetical protein